MELPPEFTLEDIELQVWLGMRHSAGQRLSRLAPSRCQPLLCNGLPCVALSPALSCHAIRRPCGDFGRLKHCTTLPHAGPPVHLVQGSAASYEWDELADLVRELWSGLPCHCFAVCRWRHKAHLGSRRLTLAGVETH